MHNVKKVIMDGNYASDRLAVALHQFVYLSEKSEIANRRAASRREENLKSVPSSVSGLIFLANYSQNLAFCNKSTLVKVQLYIETIPRCYKEENDKWHPFFEKLAHQINNLAQEELREREELMQQQSVILDFQAPPLLDGNTVAHEKTGACRIFYGCAITSIIEHVVNGNSWGLKDIVRWVQSYLQLEGEDRLTSVTVSRDREDGEIMEWFICSQTNFIIVSGIYSEKNGMRMQGVRYATPVGYKLILLGELIRMGTTAAASLVRRQL